MKSGTCSCPKGHCQACGHIAGLLYQLANFKVLNVPVIPEDKAKTSMPQTWHQPRTNKISGKSVEHLTVRAYKKGSDSQCERRAVTSTLQDPIRGSFPSLLVLKENLESISSNALILPALNVHPSHSSVATRFGNFASGSVLAVQQKLHSHYIFQVYDGVDYPDLPVKCNMSNNFCAVLSYAESLTVAELHLKSDEVVKFEQQTRLQSECPLWFSLRKNRITSSKVHDVYVRRRHFESLTDRMLSTKYIQTSAMKDGILNEPIAAECYSKQHEHCINVYPCGIVISPWAPWLAVSPDRKVYDPKRSPAFGLLEIKCPRKSIKECKYLQKIGTKLLLRRTHSYYTQIQMQLAVTGIDWCDFFVWTDTGFHMEEIRFDPVFWENVKNKVDIFFFKFFLGKSGISR